MSRSNSWLISNSTGSTGCIGSGNRTAISLQSSCLLVECYRECVSYLIAELGGGAEWNVASVCVPPLLMHMVNPSTHRNVVKGNTFICE